MAVKNVAHFVNIIILIEVVEVNTAKIVPCALQRRFSEVKDSMKFGSIVTELIIHRTKKDRFVIRWFTKMTI